MANDPTNDDGDSDDPNADLVAWDLAYSDDKPPQRSWVLRVRDRPIEILTIKWNPELMMDTQSELDMMRVLTEEFLGHLDISSVMQRLKNKLEQ